MTQDETAVLREGLAALSARVERLEQQGNEQSGTAEPAAGDVFWALNELRSRLDDHPSTADGAVMLVGAVTLPTGSPVEWQEAAGTEALFEMDWSDYATSFAALGHPVRVELLRHVLSGTNATADLAAIGSLGTTGQLHHHLRQLRAAGWLKQSGRGVYEVPPTRIVPLLAALVAATQR